MGLPNSSTVRASLEGEKEFSDRLARAIAAAAPADFAMAFFAKLFRKPPDLQEEIINMKLASKQLASASKKSEKNATKQKLAVKKAIQQNNIEGAKIYAEMAIREKKQGLQYLQMQARVDAVAARLDTALRTNQTSEALGRVVDGMGASLQSMDVERIARTMDEFEARLEDVDVKTGYMERAMDSTTGSLTPEEDVTALLHQVAEEHGLDVANAIDDAGAVGTKVPEQGGAVAEEGSSDALKARLAALR